MSRSSRPSELDIEAIKRRHLRPDQMANRTFYEGHIVIDLAALVEEVEYLRKERSAVVEFLREGDTVCMECGDRATLDLAYRIALGEHRSEEKG